ncbi:MAG: right-handed parallel beta-helix repeat-containing protein [Flavobacteriales bacterium]|nr:MAG: right-handed parallel beta-helix repeat-containing protein [Flavobacteriales bacterium]
MSPLARLLLFPLLLLTSSLSAQLNGTYSIDAGGGGDYLSFSAAVTALNTSGVSGPVVFEVADGFYTERITLVNITGSSATNTITFRGQSLDSSLVVLRSNSTTTVGGFSGPNHVVHFAGARHISFEHLTVQRTGSSLYGHVLVYASTATDINFRHCRLIGVTAPTFVNNVRNVVYCFDTFNQTGIRFIATSFSGGNYGVYWYGGATQMDELQFHDCVITSPQIHLVSINGGLSLLRNRVSTTTTGIHIFINGQGAIVIQHNLFINTTAGTAGVLLNLQGIAGTPVLVAGNMFVFPNRSEGVTLSSSQYVDLLHNSVSGMLHVSATSSNITLRNNILRGNANSGLSVQDATSITASDHNFYWSASGPTAVSWSGSHNDRNSLNAATGFDANSHFMDPLFVNNISDLHLQTASLCAGAGMAVAGQVLDFDQQARPQPALTAPDVGADETAEYCSSLSGTYVIGPSVGADFSAFASAVGKMQICGITGPVTFLVEDGTYTEQIVLPNIPGNSNVNTITFRGQSLDSSLVTLTWPTGSALPTVRMSGADRVTFEHMTIQRNGISTLQGAVVDWESTIANATTRSQYTTIRNCRLISNATTNNLSALVLGIAQNDESSVSVLYCRMQGGHTGVRWYMDTDASITIQGCVFTGQYDRSIACINPGTGDPELVIDGNVIQGPNNSSRTAVEVRHNSNWLRITGNRITANSSNGIGIDMTCTGGAPSWTQVANNMVQCTSNTRGILLSGDNNGLGVYHNSVSTSTGNALELSGTGSNSHMVGNAFRSATAYAIYRTGTIAFAAADHNVLYGGNTPFVFWGADVVDLSALRCLTGQQLNSIQADPLFVNNSNDLHLQSGSPCAGQSIFISGVDYDYDGELRALPLATLPDIGADEINEVCTPMIGTYVIGPSVGADFLNFTTAVRQLLGCGISGPVVFEVESGIYTEQVQLTAIKGSSSTNTVTFRGQALDSTTVILQYTSFAGAANNHVLANTGADHVRFEHMTLSRYGIQPNARVVHLNPACDAIVDMRLSHCVISSSGTTLLSADLVGSVLGAMPTSFVLENCALVGGGYAVYSQPLAPQDTITIVGCTRTGGTSGISLNQISGPITIRGNQLTATATDAVLVYQCTGAVDISRNRITGGTALTSSGVFVFGCQPVAPARIVVANNEIISTVGQGIRINGPSSRVDVVYNSVRTNAASGTAMLAITGGSSTDTHIRNNIFSSTSYSAATVSLTGIASDRNVFWRTGTVGNTVQWNGVPYTTVTALAAGTGTNANSKFRDPLFYSSTADLRSYSMEVDQAALPFAGITVDKNGVTRHVTTPDIGAFEFQPELWNEAFNTCGPADPIISSGTGQDQWIYKDRKVVARFNDNGQPLGLVSMNVYVHNGAVRQSVIGQRYMDRNWHLTTQNPITSGAIVRLFHSANEFAAYAAADPVVNVYADAGVAHYVGLMEDCNLPNNPAGNIWTPIFPASPALEPRIQGNGGTHGYTAVLANDGELYITTTGLPLPVELIAFTGERTSDREVMLHWTTATEHNNAGFEVWRLIEGEEEFSRVAWVEGAGESHAVINYALSDDNTTSRVSYYKLKQVDLDGHYSWSPVIAVKGAVNGNALVLFPNPASQAFDIRIGALDHSGVQLVNVSGQVVRAWGAVDHCDVQGIARGTYLVRILWPDGAERSSRLILE